MRSFLSGISIEWDSLKLASNEEHKQADITRVFWEASTQRLVVSTVYHLQFFVLSTVAEIVKTEWGRLPFKRPRMCIVQTGWETKKFKMAPVTL